jgi:hypothetical protein
VLFRSDSKIDHEEILSSEVYIALTPESGIPALGVGTATPGPGDIPGSADCSIYRIAYDGSDFVIEASAAIGRKVYNLSSQAIEGNTWVTISRDKFGVWIVTSIGAMGASIGFMVELNSGFETTGYGWKRLIAVAGGNHADHPSGETGINAYTPDENEELALGTRGWLFPSPDNEGDGTSTSTTDDTLYVFIPVYLTRTHCKEGQLYFQTSYDGGDIWIDTENLGVDCPEDTGTGTGGVGVTITGCGWLARLRERNCLYFTVQSANGECTPIDIAQEFYLRNIGDYVWTSTDQMGCGTGSGTADALFEYLTGSGLITFSIVQGVPRLQIGSYYLIWDKCGTVNGEPFIDFSGGDFLCDPVGTADDNDPNCEDNTFTVRIMCVPCPTCWYCVATEECNGTSTTNSLVALELTEDEAADLGDLVCEGPFETEAEANAACVIYGPAPECVSIPDGVNFTWETFTDSVAGACADGLTGTATSSGGSINSNNFVSCGMGGPQQFTINCVSLQYELTTPTSWGGCPGAYTGTTVASSGESGPPLIIVFELPLCLFMDGTGNEDDIVTIVFTQA